MTGDQGLPRLPRVSGSVTGSGVTELWQRQLELAETEERGGKTPDPGPESDQSRPRTAGPGPLSSV